MKSGRGEQIEPISMMYPGWLHQSSRIVQGQVCVHGREAGATCAFHPACLGFVQPSACQHRLFGRRTECRDRRGPERHEPPMDCLFQSSDPCPWAQYWNRGNPTRGAGRSADRSVKVPGAFLCQPAVSGITWTATRSVVGYCSHFESEPCEHGN